MEVTPEQSGVQIALVGAFNPAIFSPHWLIEHGIIQKGDFPDDGLEVVHPEIAKFHTTNIAIEVQKNRFTASTNAAPFINLHDVVVTLFGELLPHTPITLVGINRIVDFKLDSPEKYEKFGEALAPSGLC